MSAAPTPTPAPFFTELVELFEALTHPAALTEAGVLLACLLLSWGVCMLLRRVLPSDGAVLFGRRVIDGALFPTLALLFAFAARYALAGVIKAAVFKLAIPILTSLVVIRLTVRVLSAAFPESKWSRLLERTVSWLAWMAVVLWLSGIGPAVMAELDAVSLKLGGTTVSLRTMIEGALTAAVVMVLVLWVSAALEKKIIKGSGDDLSMRKMLSNIVRIVLLFLGLLFAMSAVGINLTALSVLGGAVGLGLGFGLQKITANYVSGFVILAERSLRIGDLVKIDNFEGRITDIRTRYTVIRSFGGREAIVPNEMLITQRVENASLADPSVLLQTTVQVAYGTDVPRVQAALVEVMVGMERILKDPAPSVHLINFASDGIDLQLNFWIGDPENGQGNMRSQVNVRVLQVFDELGVEIPYPQRVLHQVVPKAAQAVVAPTVAAREVTASGPLPGDSPREPVDGE